jgi:hypothetical protein
MVALALAMVTRSVGGACGWRGIVGCKVQVPDENLTIIACNVLSVILLLDNPHPTCKKRFTSSTNLTRIVRSPTNAIDAGVMTLDEFGDWRTWESDIKNLHRHGIHMERGQ